MTIRLATTAMLCTLLTACAAAQEPDLAHDVADANNTNLSQPAQPDIASDQGTLQELPLSERVIALEERVRDLQDIIRRLEDAIAQMNRDVPNNLLGAMSQNAELTKDLAVATQGRINIQNYTGAQVPIYINGTRWIALKNESYIYAPVGTVAFQRPGSSEPQFFGRDDWQRIDGVMQLSYRIEAE